MKLTGFLFTFLSFTLSAQTATVIDLSGGQTVMELTGQVINTGAASVQAGYLNYVRGFNNVFSGATQDESTAMFTFFTTVTTTRSVLNGTIRIVDREGTTSVYLASQPGDFSHPDSFRSGTVIQTSSIRQQVMVDTTSSAFTVWNFNVVNAASSFSVKGVSYQFGMPGQTFRTSLTGHLTATSPPSGYFGGSAFGTNDSVPFLSATPNPAPPGNSAGLGQVTLTWGAPGVSQVEIHLGAPDGILMTGGGPSGSVTTGAWVSNGLNFYLQDVTGGKPLISANTLARLTVIVQP